MVLKASMQCPYPAVDPIENETDLAIEEEKEWLKARLQADRRWSEGQSGGNHGTPGRNKRRRFNSNDGEAGKDPEQTLAIASITITTKKHSRAPERVQPFGPCRECSEQRHDQRTPPNIWQHWHYRKNILARGKQ